MFDMDAPSSANHPSSEDVASLLESIASQIEEAISSLPEWWEEMVDNCSPMDFTARCKATMWNERMCHLLEPIFENAGFVMSKRGGFLTASYGENLVFRFKKLYGRNGRSSKRNFNSHLYSTQQTFPGFEIPTVVVIGYVETPELK